MRRDDLYLHDIIEAIDHIDAFLREDDHQAFLKSEMVRSAVVQKLVIVGEAAARISEGLRNRNPQVPWPAIVAFRNILIHAYFGIDWDEVWKAAKVECPILREQVAQIVAAESGRPESEAAQ
jgi:uncharacterized protein with HEPN domain